MSTATPQRELRGDLLVVAPGVLSAAFRIAGVRAVRADDAAQAHAAVAAELDMSDTGGAPAPGIVAVHRALWDRLPEPVRRGWDQQLTPLVVPLPADTGRAGVGRGQALRELLARSVGYEITFSTEGDSP
ncbi:hypothetical protein TUM20983_37080 [Mycobacterium antarcticum]|uniref:V-type ATP synthase subunit F n=1 Tax=Mycolicibacterium sp. TUM20983 TaxID=3023369 RepID=UPI00239F6AA6|nr:V-type ATP synthase subunit F [Mycolicibacterium sp. TUM20983]GLP76598.1 hypothetical protein TUM20983_37080 [Mycolicibacterium sp. TUM20983]